MLTRKLPSIRSISYINPSTKSLFSLPSFSSYPVSVNITVNRKPLNPVRPLSTNKQVAMPVNSTSMNSFDSNHELYDLVRPGFSPAVVDEILKKTNLGPGARVIDLAAGTGKFTAQIANKGFEITAVEPSKGMRTSFKNNFPEIPIVDGSSYSLPFADDYQADALFMAQAYHWFSDKESLKEIARVLKPGGHAIMFWNFEDIAELPADHWQKRVTELIWSLDGDVPQYRHMNWPKSFDNQPYFETPYNEKFFYFDRLYPDDADTIWKYWLTRSYVTALPDEKKAEVRAKVYEIFENSKKEYNGDKVIAKTGVHVVWAKKIDN